MNINKKLYSGLIIILIIVLFSGIYLNTHKVNTPSLSSEQGYDEKKNSTSTIIPVFNKSDTFPTAIASQTFHLIAGTTDLMLPVTNKSLLSILMSAQKREDITFSGKEYGGLGFFVTELGSLKEGNNKHLTYYINGKEASVGVSLYIPRVDDLVIWKLK